MKASHHPCLKTPHVFGFSLNTNCRLDVFYKKRFLHFLLVTLRGVTRLHIKPIHGDRFTPEFNDVLRYTVRVFTFSQVLCCFDWCFAYIIGCALFDSTYSISQQSLGSLAGLSCIINLKLRPVFPACIANLFSHCYFFVCPLQPTWQ